LRVVRVWYNAVRLGEVVKITIVPTSIVEHEAEVRGVFTLSSRNFQALS
jgi:hypothetical protein